MTGKQLLCFGAVWHPEMEMFANSATIPNRTDATFMLSSISRLLAAGRGREQLELHSREFATPLRRNGAFPPKGAAASV